MVPADIALSELERDALTEVVNIGVSRAAASLRKMVGEQVLLSVPAIEVMDQKRAAALVGERESDELVAVRQDFSGAFAGRALLIFPQASSLELVRAVTGEDMTAAEMAEMEGEALSEPGNVILNSCLATMANMLQRSLAMSLPAVVRGESSALMAGPSGPASDAPVLFLYINFVIAERAIRGYIVMLMDLPSMSALKLLIADFIDSIMGTDAAAGG